MTDKKDRKLQEPAVLLKIMKQNGLAYQLGIREPEVGK